MHMSIRAPSLTVAFSSSLLITAYALGASPALAANEAPEQPIAVSGAAVRGPCPSDGETTEREDLASTRDGYCNPIWFMSDPRLGGTVTWASNEDRYRGDSQVLVRSVAVSVADDDGAWRMVPEIQFGSVGEDPAGLPAQFTLVGEGAYAGLHAVLSYDPATDALTGFIVSGGLPPDPGGPPAS